MVIQRGEVWWADLGEPRGSKAAYRRPVIVVQDDFLNRSGIRTIIVVPLSSNLDRVSLSTNVLLKTSATKLARDSVAICASIEAVNREDFLIRVSMLPSRDLESVEYALQRTLGLAD